MRFSAVPRGRGWRAGGGGGMGGEGGGAVDHRLHQTYVPPAISFVVVVGFYTVLVVDASVSCVVCPRSVGEFGRCV